MAQAFSRDPVEPSVIVGFLEDNERALVIELMHQTSVLLSDGSDDDDAAPGSADDDIFAALSRSMAERQAPTDPALRRLLPDGVMDDASAASEFRRLTEASLRDGKLRNLDVAMRALERNFIDDEQAAAIADDVYQRSQDAGAAGGSAGGPREDGAADDLRDGLDDGAREVVLDEAQARAMMFALTDVRLVLAERLDLRTDEDTEALTQRIEGGGEPESSEDLLAMYYEFLTWMSESLTLAVMRKA